MRWIKAQPLYFLSSPTQNAIIVEKEIESHPQPKQKDFLDRSDDLLLTFHSLTP